MSSFNTQNEKFATALAELLAPIKQPLKLIIHGGTPKTGTTSLQVYLDKKQRKLRQRGILYPNHRHNFNAPKHQWLEKNLVRIHPQNLLDNFQQILSHVDENTHTILLSSEGFYNHWWDFSAESKVLLSEINKLFDVNIWVWFRDPVSFAESFYKQCMRNPAIGNISCYGKDLSFAEILDDPWFNKHLDYLGFVEDCAAIFGKSSVSVFEYQQDTVKTVIKLLGLATPHDNPTPRKNKSMETTTIELYRVINRLKLSAKDKDKLVPHLQALNTELATLKSRNTSNVVDENSRNKILKVTAKSMLELQKRYVKDE